MTYNNKTILQMPRQQYIKSREKFKEKQQMVSEVIAGDVKKGDIILLKGRPCVITNISVSK